MAPGTTPKRRRRMLWSGVAVGAVVILAAGGVTVAMNLAGSGTTLDSLAPADTVAYAELNLDPPAGQKVAVLRYLDHISALKIDTSASNFIDGIVGSFPDNTKSRKQWTEDIRPWLGSHIAVIGDPQGGKVQPVVIVETTDADKAQVGLAKVGAEQGFGFVLSGKTAVIADTKAIAQQTVDDAKGGSLSGNKTYHDDIKAAGGNDGIVTGWADVGRASKYLTQAGVDATILKSVSTLRVATSLRFTDTSADLIIKYLGDQSAVDKSVKDAAPVAGALANLPADTAAAMGLSGGDKAVRAMVDQLRASGADSVLAPLEQDLGLVLPDDLAALLGSTTVAAFGGTADAPSLGLASKTSDRARAHKAAQRLAQAIGLPSDLGVLTTADGVVLASSPDYAAQLTGKGGLGATERFRAALPDVSSAQLAVYLDLVKIGELTGQTMPAGLQTVGMTASVVGDVGTVHLRVVVG